MASIMISNRKVHKKLTKLTDYKSLIEEIRVKFSNINLNELSLTYKYDKEQGQMELLNDQSIDVIRNSKKNTKIFICRAIPQKLQNRASSTLQSGERFSFTTQKSIKTTQLLKDTYSKGQQKKLQEKIKPQIEEKLIQRSEYVSRQQENLYCHVGVSCFRCKRSNIVGNRYKCQFCPDFNLCNICYKLKDQQNIHQTNHTFYIIKNNLFFEAINYFQVFSHFFGYQLNEQKGNMSLKEFNIKNHKFNKQIEYYRQKVIQQLDVNLQNWQKQFQAQLSKRT